ncbi:Hypothetical_protein [Hexamita inflata]|uniref:Hypothetical_protein n=1 Tax=Hexamita inflata TaxID=28002 RepID=A0AA86TS62_9EUKA|nr:Hypothetical protein HINF_LOCUS8163 [Hexamita inflata]
MRPRTSYQRVVSYRPSPLPDYEQKTTPIFPVPSSRQYSRQIHSQLNQQQIEPTKAELSHNLLQKKLKCLQNETELNFFRTQCEQMQQELSVNRLELKNAFVEAIRLKAENDELRKTSFKEDLDTLKTELSNAKKELEREIIKRMEIEKELQFNLNIKDVKQEAQNQNEMNQEEFEEELDEEEQYLQTMLMKLNQENKQLKEEVQTLKAQNQELRLAK